MTRFACPSCGPNRFGPSAECLCGSCYFAPFSFRILSVDRRYDGTQAVRWEGESCVFTTVHDPTGG